MLVALVRLDLVELVEPAHDDFRVVPVDAQLRERSSRAQPHVGGHTRSQERGKRVHRFNRERLNTIHARLKHRLPRLGQAVLEFRIICQPPP
jgi:hypothetical protein